MGEILRGISTHGLELLLAQFFEACPPRTFFATQAKNKHQSEEYPMQRKFDLQKHCGARVKNPDGEHHIARITKDLEPITLVQAASNMRSPVTIATLGACWLRC